MPTLVINCGSSSLKFALIDEAGATLASGIAERLGTPDASLTLHQTGPKRTIALAAADHAAALERLTAELGTDLQPTAIGHRVVHGGEKFRGAALITPDVLECIDEFARLAPLHNPANALGIRTTLRLFPQVPQVALFDTAFHQTLPPHAYLYAIPYDFYATQGIRRYGFHGTSHHYVSLRAAEILNQPAGNLQFLTAHLGNGCSACAIRDGRSVDTTMGLTPLEGLVMGTRSGDVDPNLHQFLAENTGVDLATITNILNRQSGLLGISGVSNDLRTLTDAAVSGHERAALAIEVFCYRLAKGLLAMTAALDRLDALVFTGGIGENSPLVRAKTIDHLRVLHATVDPTRNADHGRTSNACISLPHTRPTVLVIPTNEEAMIAQSTTKLIQDLAAKPTTNPPATAKPA